MKYLIFGGTGFVGKNLANFLESREEEVIAVSSSGTYGTMAIDITSKEDFSRLDFVPDVIVNCASKLPSADRMSSDPDFLKELYLTNVVGGANISNWAVAKKVRRVINCSTMVVVKKPWPVPLREDSVGIPEGFHAGYCLSKLSQEKIMNECARGTETKILHARLSAVYGKGMKEEGIIFNLLSKALAGEKISLSNASKNTIDLINVEDVAQCLWLLSKSEKALHHGILNLGSGQEISILDLANRIKKITNSGSEIHNATSSESESRASIDISNLRSIIGKYYGSFVDLNSGLHEIVKDFMNHQKRP